MKGLIRKDLAAAKALNSPHFVKSIGKIYPPQLELKRTTEGLITCSYLDLNNYLYIWP